MVLSAAGSEVLGNHFDASIYMLAKNEGGRSKPILSKYTQMLFSQTWSVPCRVDLRKSIRIKYDSISVILSIQNLSLNTASGKGMLIPGEHANVRLTIFKKMVMNNGQPFTIREGHISVATGIITKALESVELPFNKLSKVEID